MEKCPPFYRDNCSNYIYKCSLCRAGDGKDSAPLYYKPVEGNRKDHPATRPKKQKQIDKKRSHYSKAGYRKEKELIKDIAKATLKSGAVLGDGDIELLKGLINLDSKKRHNSSSFTVTKAEYEKGIARRLSGWAITNKEDKTLICLTMTTFNHLLALLKNQEQ